MQEQHSNIQPNQGISYYVTTATLPGREYYPWDQKPNVKVQKFLQEVKVLANQIF